MLINTKTRQEAADLLRDKAARVRELAREKDHPELWNASKEFDTLANLIEGADSAY